MATNATPEGRTRIVSEINSAIFPNTQKLITAEEVREMLYVINCSKFNLVDDKLGDLKLDSSISNSQTLSTIINNLETIVEDLVKPVFFIEFEVTDSNPGGGNNPTRNISIIATNYNGTVGEGSTRSDRPANSVALNILNLGFVPRVTNASMIKIESASGGFTRVYIHIPPYSNFSNFKQKVYFYKDYSSNNYTI